MEAPAEQDPEQLQDLAVMGVLKQALASNSKEVFKLIFEQKPQELLEAVCEHAPMRRKLLHHVRRLEHTPLTTASKEEHRDKTIYVELRVRGQDSAQDDEECTVAINDLPEYLVILFKALIMFLEANEKRERDGMGCCTDGRDVDPTRQRDGSGVFRLFMDDEKLREHIDGAIRHGHLAWAQIERICNLTGIDCPTDEDEEDGEEDGERDLVDEHEDWIDETFLEELPDHIEGDLHNFSEAIMEAGKKTRTKKRTLQQFFDAPRMKLIVDSSAL